ncbi:GNAT family N-acetyltransferase [Chitinophaga agrisoli]|uniref:GNAT family N-acetyltransferase n=1 Tax=Chitinophaga agrisoli TaxID=2607653 RepID=A0A5B2W249_9BACT|nr:GNAT family N-acetyltransferase [Chitinophaga agrisoli]KAA2244557.1 GNAT family N-acetyltransferase [Chitinophaga agrisoli]
MQITVIKTELPEVAAFRLLFLQENDFQFVHNKCHLYGWADTYLLLADGKRIGYAAVWGQESREERDAVFEFYVIPAFRKAANLIFPELLAVCGAPYIECQSNDHLLSSMLYEHAHHINAEAILFEEHYTTQLTVPDITFRRLPNATDTADNAGGYVLERQNELVADGGFMLNYNMPYADIYMNVMEGHRRQGLGSYIVQELKREAYLMGRVPAARCNIRNQASKATLLKAGFRNCGVIMKGEVRR